MSDGTCAVCLNHFDDLTCVDCVNDAVEQTVKADRALLKQAEAERDEARDWVRRMYHEQSVLTCVYCGHAYPPGTPPSNAEALTAHVAVCPKHPMAADRALLRRIVEGWNTNDHGKALTIAIAEARARIGEPAPLPDSKE